MRYVDVPKEVSFEQLRKNGSSFSSAQYKSIILPNSSFIYVRDFLTRELTFDDLGNEIGSLNYVDKSPKYFVRTKSLQSHSFIPDVTSESVIPMNPKVFIDQNLKEGDIIISKDSNIGEVVILDKDYPNWMFSGALYRLPVGEFKYYLLAFLKHDFFRQQIDFIVPKSATIRHAKTLFLECKIPFPTKEVEKVTEYVEALTRAIIEKEKKIKGKYDEIQNIILSELQQHQKDKDFAYELPSLTDMMAIGRIDTNLYRPYFKKQEFLIKNYVHGFSSIRELHFDISRGQNLQVSNIGESAYSERHHTGFYTLMLPKHLSKYGTAQKVEYLGNPRDLKVLKVGDLIFGAEGFEKGRSIVVVEWSEKTITNIHGITLHQREGNTTLSIFIKCFLDYLRSTGMVDLYAVGGNGGSLAQKYWDVIPFPNFPEEKQKGIALLYHNPKANYDVPSLTLENFGEKDEVFNEIAGIIELDRTAKRIKERLDEVIDQIIKDKPVEITFDFLKI
jgi:type I restriction enzyme S subunit